MSFPCYERYKDSGPTWFGKVPTHWHIFDGRRVFSLKREASLLDDPQLSATQKYGVIPQALFMELEGQKVVLALKGTDAFKHVEKDDFIISLRSFQGGIEKSHYRGCVSTAYTVLRKAKTTDSRYWEYLFKCSTYIDALSSVTDGIREGRSISYSQFGGIPLPFPTMPEQSAIASFLDYETAKIDALIEEQRRLIALLKEKRQAVISHAVTKGLNSNVPMKDSGIEWMGHVPAHWAVMSLGRVTASACDGPFGSGLKSDHYSDEGVRVIRLQNIRDGEFDGTDSAFIDANHYASLGDHDVHSGDLLIAGLGDDRYAVGRACVAPRDIEPAMVKADCFRFRLSSEAVPKFVGAQLSIGAPTDAGRLASGSTRSRIPVSKMSSRGIAFPDIVEQSAIVHYLLKKESEFTGLISQTRLSIHLLQERRSALISAAVTGKIDVRNYTPKEAA
jgi:type I restriction enzyme S subunit